jgi:hypothetical protein
MYFYDLQCKFCKNCSFAAWTTVMEISVVYFTWPPGRVVCDRKQKPLLVAAMGQ